MLNSDIEYKGNSKYFVKNVKIYISAFLIVLFLIFSNYFKLSEFTIIALFLVSAALTFVLNFKFIFYLFIISIFIGIIYYYFALSEYVSILVLISFILTYKFELSEIKNPVLPFFLLFIASIIPSYFNSGALSITLLLSYRLFAFFFLFTITSIVISNYSDFSRVLKFYVLMALINGVQVIYLGLTTGKRVFGFASTMYVDLVSVALIICFIGFIYKKNKRLRYAAGTFILTCALIFTQTRGIWIVACISLISIMIHACFNSERVGVKRINMIYSVITSFLIIVSVVILLLSTNPSTYERVDLHSKSDTQVTFGNIGSVTTRYFIWNTAWNAFKAHPVIGIGYYSFPFTSHDYSTISPLMYKVFVQKLTAHTTILALLAEAGILGFVGFLIFLFGTLKFAKKNLKRSLTESQWYYSLIIFWISFYMSLSMIVTDAWLWGTLLMIWGIILGLSIANYKLICEFNNETSMAQKTI